MRTIFGREFVATQGPVLLLLLAVSAAAVAICTLFFTAERNQDGTVSEQEARKQQNFATMILDNLRRAGGQNTRKEERLTFDRLDLYAGGGCRAGSLTLAFHTWAWPRM